MHVMTKYLDTRKATINALEDFTVMELAAQGHDAQAATMIDDLTSPRSTQLDGMPHAHDPHAGEQRLAATLDKIDLLAQRTRQAREYLDWFLPAWQSLTGDDQYVLNTFFLGEGSQDDRVMTIADHFYVERDTVYRKKNRALERLSVALYGKL